MFYLQSFLCARTDTFIESVLFLKRVFDFSNVFFPKLLGSPAVFSRLSFGKKEDETLRAFATLHHARESVVHERVYARNTAAQHGVFISKSESESARDDFKTSRRARTIARESAPSRG